MFGFEKFSVGAWVESGLTLQPKAVNESKPTRRSGSWKIVASVLVGAAIATSTIATAARAIPAGTVDELHVIGSADMMHLGGVGDSPALLTHKWNASASHLLKAGIAPAMSDDVRALALQVISDQKQDADADIEAWARSLVEDMFS